MKRISFAVFAVFLMTLHSVFGISATAQSVYESDLDYIYTEDYGYESDYDYDYYDDYTEVGESYGGSFEWGSSILIAVVIGLIAAGITTGVMYSQLKNVKLQTRAEDYVVAGSMNVTESRDLFLYQHTTRVAKPKKNK